MSRKPKYSFDVKVKACEDYINGERSLQQIARDIGLKSANGSIKHWISSYRKHGPDGLLPAIKNPVYTKSFKLKVVEEYIDGKGSINDLAAKYGIKSIETLHRWILRYNSDSEKELIQAIREFIDYYNNGRYQERFDNLTPMEVRKAALHSNQPTQYPISANKRIQSYKAELELKKQKQIA